MDFSVQTDKPSYAPGEVVTLTASYSVSPPEPFTVQVTAEAADPADPSSRAVATTSYTVQPPAPEQLTITVSDDHGGSWAEVAHGGGTAVFEQTAPARPAVPSGFSGPEPPLSALAGMTAFSWCGCTWETENWGTGPGQPSAANVSVNADGHLVLTARQADGAYRGAEINSARGDAALAGNTSTWGYGRYRWVIGTDLSALPSPLVLGLFTYWAQSKGGPPGQKEIDIEVSGWGNPVPPFLQMGFYQDTGQAQTAAVPPEHTLTDGSQVPVRAVPAMTAEFTWLPDHITWNVWYSRDASAAPDYTLSMRQGQVYSYTEPYGGNRFAGTVEIPATGGQQVIMNLWSYGQAVSEDTQVVIESFSYTPA